MSTDYKVFSKGNSSFDLFEHSNMFDICVDANINIEDQELSIVRNLTLHELKEVVKNLAEIISYFDTDYNGVVL